MTLTGSGSFDTSNVLYREYRIVTLWFFVSPDSEHDWDSIDLSDEDHGVFCFYNGLCRDFWLG